MHRAVGFGASLMGLAVPVAAAGLWVPAWRVAAFILAGIYALLGFLVLALRPTHSDADDVMVGFVLFRMPRLALGVAVAEDSLLLAFLVAIFFGRGAAAWPAFVLLSAVALGLAGIGITAWLWSLGRGTRARRWRAAGGLVAAVVLALVPWAIRSVLVA